MRENDRTGSTSSHDRVTDPVCGMQIRPEKAAATFVRHGTTYFFCTDACRRQFEVDPDAYTDSSIDG